MAKKVRQTQTVGALLAGAERLFLQIIIGLIAPVVFLLIGWWGSLLFVPEDSIKYFALGGLLVGLFIDMLFLRRWVRKAYTLPKTWFILVYLFYSICLLGFFMGVPVFNLFMGAVGGYYVGMCLRYANKDKTEVNSIARSIALFAAIVLALICIASLTIAYLDQSLAANIQGLFNLSSEVSRETILTVSAFGGILMVIVEYFLTRTMVKFACFM